MARWAAALSRSGGLVYHWSAWRHRPLWSDHLAATAQFLGEWTAPERSIVLIGTSAGYSLPKALFERFDTVAISEPDPVARRLFSRRFPGVRPTWLDDDFIGPREGRLTVAGLTELRARFPDHAVLFCNILGQLPVIHDIADGPAFAQYLGQVAGALKGTSWASYHDRVSGPWPPQISSLQLDAAIETEDLMNRCYAPLPDGAPLEFWDHQMGPLAPELPRSVWLWQRAPDAFHLIEAVRVTRA